MHCQLTHAHLHILISWISKGTIVHVGSLITKLEQKFTNLKINNIKLKRTIKQTNQEQWKLEDDY
jgi:hypothetical protein